MTVQELMEKLHMLVNDGFGDKKIYNSYHDDDDSCYEVQYIIVDSKNQYTASAYDVLHGKEEKNKIILL
jgi:hypothetical protein